MAKKEMEIATIEITPAIIDKLKEAIKVSLDFEKLTGKQLNITSVVGEIVTCERLKLKLVVNDINESFDAIDGDNNTVQIKTRRYKGADTAMTGPLLDMHFKANYDYAILTLLNEDYTFKEFFRIDAGSIERHFARINAKRIAEGKGKRTTMSISQFKAIANNAFRSSE